MECCKFIELRRGILLHYPDSCPLAAVLGKFSCSWIHCCNVVPNVHFIRYCYFKILITVDN